VNTVACIQFDACTADEADEVQVSDWRKLGNKIRNWGRWGDDDQLGTLNFITPQKLTAAATLVRTGKAFALAIPLDGDGPQGGFGIRRNPIHLMSIGGTDADIVERLGDWGGGKVAEVKAMYGMGPARFNDDYLVLAPQSTTQWDALSHVYYDGQLYNGFPAGAVTSLGAARDSIQTPAALGKVVSRGVLLDVARHRGVSRLEPNTAIGSGELDEVAARQGVRIESGDVIVVRTGWRNAFTEGMPADAWMAGSPGLSWECAEWLWEHEVAAVASDNPAVEAMVPVDGCILVLHMLALRDLGLMLGEIWDLEALGADCAEDGVYEFLLAAPPLRITGGVGSAINPIALK
jgi:kynurenine formamidase